MRLLQTLSSSTGRGKKWFFKKKSFPLWISTLSTDHLGFAVRLVSCYLQGMNASSTCIFLFWLAFLGRSQNLPFWTYVSKSTWILSQVHLLQPTREGVDGRRCHLSCLAGQDFNQFAEGGNVSQVKWQPLYGSQWLLLGLTTSSLDYGLGDYDKLSIALREIPFYHRGLHSGSRVIFRVDKILWDKMLIHWNVS